MEHINKYAIPRKLYMTQDPQRRSDAEIEPNQGKKARSSRGKRGDNGLRKFKER